jgi:hypothetical protein
MQHDCYIGLRYDYENTDIVTLEELKQYIETEQTLAEQHKDSEWWQSILCKYTLDDYCDMRKSTNLTRFRYCPMCGKKIEWKQIKNDP